MPASKSRVLTKQRFWAGDREQLTLDNIRCLFRYWVLALFRTEFGDLNNLCYEDEENPRKRGNKRFPPYTEIEMVKENGKSHIFLHALTWSKLNILKTTNLLATRHLMFTTYKVLLFRYEPKHFMKKFIFLQKEAFKSCIQALMRMPHLEKRRYKPACASQILHQESAL